MTDSSPQRELILDSAVAILAAKGQAGLTVRAVADASGFSTTGVYTWFGGKEGLLEAIYSDGFSRFRAHIATADVEPQPRERLEQAAALYWEWALANPTHYLLMFTGVPALFGPSPEAAAEALLAFTDLEARVEAIWGPTPELAHHIWATLHGYTMLQLGGPPLPVSEGFSRFQRGVERLLAQSS